LLVLVAGYIALFGSMGAIFARTGTWISGVYWGGTLIGLIWSIAWFASLDGGLFVRAGGWAEEWTSEALIKRGNAFTVIDDFPLGGWNLDHVLIGLGGVFALETKWKGKWKNRELELKNLRLERHQATYQAEELRQILLSLGHEVPVRPAVVAWGPGIPVDEPYVQFGRVGVFVGDRWKDWPRQCLDREELPIDDVRAIAGSLKAYARQHSPHLEMSLPRRSVRVVRALVSPTLHR
jgi:hypothetical protein